MVNYMYLNTYLWICTGRNSKGVFHEDIKFLLITVCCPTKRIKNKFNFLGSVREIGPRLGREWSQQRIRALWDTTLDNGSYEVYTIVTSFLPSRRNCLPSIRLLGEFFISINRLTLSEALAKPR